MSTAPSMHMMPFSSNISKYSYDKYDSLCPNSLQDTSNFIIPPEGIMYGEVANMDLSFKRVCYYYYYSEASESGSITK